MYRFTDIKKGTRDGFGEAIAALGQKQQNLVVLAAGVGDSTKAFDFKKRFPERYIEAGIAEQNMIGLAAGLALGGKIPIATSFATFLPGRCYDQIRQSVCYSNLNVKMVSTHAGLSVGADGATHQMMEDLAMLRALPNLTLVVACDALEAKKATEAIVEHGGPMFLRLGREPIPIFTDAKTPFKLGKAVTLREGKDATIIANGLMVYHSLLAAEQLEKQGISVRVINMHTLKPIDKDAIIKAARDTKLIVTAEEHQIYGGLGGAVAEVVAQNYPVPMRIVGMKDRFGESGDAKELLEKYQLTPEEIALAVKSLKR